MIILLYKQLGTPRLLRECKGNLRRSTTMCPQKCLVHIARVAWKIHILIPPSSKGSPGWEPLHYEGTSIGHPLEGPG